MLTNEIELTGKAKWFYLKFMGPQSMVACSSSQNVRQHKYMSPPKSKVRKILQRNKMGEVGLSREDRKAQYIALIFACLFLIPVYILLVIALPITLSGVVKFAIPGIILGALSLPLFYFFFFKDFVSSRKNRAIAILEEKQERKAKEIILETLGKKIYLELNPNFNPININQINLCKDLLKQEFVRSDDNLRFHIYLKLYKFYIIDENYSGAIEALKSSLKIKQNDIISKICLAETYESIGNGEEAIKVYTGIKASVSNSQKIVEYVVEQIRRVEKDGPRKAPPITGFRYMTY